MTTGNDTYRVLLVASGDDGLARALARAGVAGPLVEETDVDRALARAVSDEHDIIVVDQRVRGPTGVDVVSAIRARGSTAALILYAPEPDDEVEAAAVAAGVTDVLCRDDLGPARLARRIRLAARTARADAESAQSLVRAQQAATARDELLAIVSHDLRSPLNAIVLACDALEGDISDSERRRYVGAIRRAGQRAERLLRDLLDVSRIESGALRLECRAVSARSILEQTRADHEIVARDVGSQLALDIDGDPGQIFADRDRVLQVLANLVGNSLKHAAGTPIRLEARGDADGVELVVADSGPGIAEEQLPHVFDRFWQGRARRRGGAGLGLTIAKGIVEAHSGRISVSSTVGQGTRFTIRLPRPPRTPP
jgi:signal transduction histidine kinase